MSVEEARILVHEMGHDFEFQNANMNGLTSIWDKIAKTIFVEVSSSFFEYSFINYLVDNKIYEKDAMMLKRRYLNQIFYFLSYVLIIFNQSYLDVDGEFNIKLDNQKIVNYANGLLEMMNSDDKLYNVGDKLNFRSAFVYGFGKLLGITEDDLIKGDVLRKTLKQCNNF